MPSEKPTGSVAVSASIQAFGDVATFHTMKLAIELEKDWLSKREMALLINIFGTDPLAAHAYQLMQDDEELRREWIRIKLNSDK